MQSYGVIYLEDSSVVDSDSHDFYANLTVLGLHHIEIVPSTWDIYCGENKNFLVKGYDQFGNVFSLEPSQINWSCDYGTMSPWSGGSVSTFTAPTIPKIGLHITADYNTFSINGTIRVYPKIGEFGVHVSRTWKPFPSHFYARLAQEILKDTYGREWGSLSYYPNPKYQYFDCWDGIHYPNTPAYTFPRKYDTLGVMNDGLNVTEYVHICKDETEGNWPAIAGYDYDSDGYTWNVLNVLGSP